MITTIAETIVKLEEMDSVLWALWRDSGDGNWDNWRDRLDCLCRALTSELRKREHEALQKLKEPGNLRKFIEAGDVLLEKHFDGPS